jgi:hypothetical protein
LKRSTLAVVIGVVVTVGCFAIAFALAALIAPRLMQTQLADSPRTLVVVTLVLLLAGRMFFRLRRRGRGKTKPPPDVPEKPLSLDE